MIKTGAGALKLLAIGVLLTLGITLTFLVQQALTSRHLITTGASQWRHTTLSDGTTVHVDARSRVNIEYQHDARLVSVEQGSAVFEVAKDPRRPFIVRTHLVEITAVGTRFGVSIHPGVTTTVSEGVVKVTARATRGMATGIILKAGEELRVPEGPVQAPIPLKVDATRKLEWATGWLVFEGGTIADVVNELNRRNAVQIAIEPAELAARPIGGFQRFKVDSSAAYARYLAQTNNLELVEERSGSVLHLRPKANRGQ